MAIFKQINKTVGIAFVTNICRVNARILALSILSAYGYDAIIGTEIMELQWMRQLIGINILMMIFDYTQRIRSKTRQDHDSDENHEQ